MAEGEWTSITVRKETKERLAQEQDDGESWDAFFTRWITNDPPEADKTLARIEEQLDGLDEAVAESVIDTLNNGNSRQF